MAVQRDPSKELERIEQEIRSCRETLVDADESQRETLCDRLLLLNRELNQAIRALSLSQLDLTTSLDPANKTHSIPQVDQTVSVGDGPAAASDTVSFDVPRQQAAQPKTQLGDYEILAEIAKGGMGVVYKARHIKLKRVVALKMIRSGEFAEESQIKRFYTEAEAAAKLDHSGIVPVYDVGETGGQHYYSMAFIEGRSLNDRVKDEGPLSPEQAARIIRDTAQAVEQAHASDVLHRDLKPHNIMLDADGQPKVTDFGLAKLQQTDSEMTACGQILGTPAYMPPEQAAGRMNEVGVAADVYSLGATLYFALTGRPPFQSASVTDTLRQVIEDEPVAPRQLSPTIPRDLETICLKTLRKEADKRYDSASAFADDLQRWLNGEPIQARRVSRFERAWKWCKRKPVVVASIVTIVMLLIVGSIVLWERQNATYANGLVERLGSAAPNEVSRIVAEVPDYEFWITDDLRTSFEQSDDPSRQKLHAAVGVLALDDVSLDYLQQKLLSVAESDFAYVRVICDALGPHQEATIAYLWERFNNDSLDSATRFRAGLALSHLVGESDQWDAKAPAFLIEQLVKTNAVYQSEVWALLEPAKSRLLKPLEQVFSASDRNESEQLAAANAIAFFASQDSERLTRLLLIANGPQFKILFEKYLLVVDDRTREVFAKTLEQEPTDDQDAEARLALGKARATAAIVLLHLGERDLILNELSDEDDPETLTQFVHRCKARGVLPSQLIELFEIVDQQRGSLDGIRQKINDSLMYALLLSLGEFSRNELPSGRGSFVDRLARIYERDPSSGVHGATGWLLRQWGQLDSVNRVDQTPLAYDSSGHHEWYVQEIEYASRVTGGVMPETMRLYLTFVVFEPAEFTMGSPKDEPMHEYNENQHQVTLTRRIAISDRELTWGRWNAMEGTKRRDTYATQFSKMLNDDGPVFGVNWFDAVKYCRWLSEQVGVPEDQQCYANPSSLPKDGEGNPTDWPLRLEGSGFRLPTEAEWEYICRNGTRTSYSFGQDEHLLGQYAWYLKNSGAWSHATRELRPNPRGLFDTHGNVSEWCHDRFNGDELSKATDPTGAEAGRDRVVRGGSWGGAVWKCRSSSRDGIASTNRGSSLGFRLAIVPSSQESEAGQ